MKRKLLLLSFVLLAVMAGPSLFACEDCPDTVNCVPVDAGALKCVWDQTNGWCFGWGWCPLEPLPPVQSQYRVAAVRVIDPAGKVTAQPKMQPKAAPLLVASK